MRRLCSTRSSSIGTVVVVAAVLLLGGCASTPRVAAGHHHHTSLPSSSGGHPRAPSALLLSDTGARPRGWVPIEDGRAEISVPPTWRESILGCEEPTKDAVVIDDGVDYCPAQPPLQPPSLTGSSWPSVTIRPYHVPGTERQPAQPNTRRFHVNGIVAYEAPGAVYDVPSLGVSLDFFGRTDRAVLDTLTRSPRVVALATGAAPKVPAGWRRVSFAGLRFAQPASWPVTRTSTFSYGGEPCSAQDVMSQPASAVLSSARYRTHVYGGCPLILARFTPSAPHLGLVLDAGTALDAPMPLPSTHCRHRAGLWLCVNPAERTAILVIYVWPPPQPEPSVAGTGPVHPDILELGLAGSGLVDRTILDSLRPG